MQRLSRRAAIGATSLALLLAATGTSLAAVRSARDEGGAAPGGVALPTPATDGSAPDDTSGPVIDLPGVGLQDPVVPGLQPGAPDAGVALGPGAPSGTSPSTTTTTTSPSTTVVASSPAPAPSASGTSAQPSRSASVPVGGPSPTLPPGGVTPPTTGCPSDVGRGAVPPPTGQLQAVTYTLPWPGPVPLVLLPQLGATRPAGGHARIGRTSAGVLGPNGSSLVLSRPDTTAYTLLAGEAKAQGTIHFTGIGQTVNVDRTACRDRSFVLHDVGEEMIGGRALRIVGIVAPVGLVTVEDHGGTAHFRSATAGTYQVTILTANDAGVAAPLITATVTVR